MAWLAHVYSLAAIEAGSERVTLVGDLRFDSGSTQKISPKVVTTLSRETPMMVPMATTTMMARVKAREIRARGRVRLGLARRPPRVNLPVMVATSNDPTRVSLARVPRRVPPRPASRDERDLAGLMREILPEEG